MRRKASPSPSPRDGGPHRNGHDRASPRLRLLALRSPTGRRVPWLRAVVAAVVGLLFGWNILWLHEQERRGSVASLGMDVLDFQRQATSDGDASSAAPQWIDHRIDGDPADDSLSSRTLNEERQRRTRPPTRPAPPSETHTGPWRRKPQRVVVPWTHNWELLCEKANLDETSRVVITNILSQPPGAPLALFLAAQCGVRDILGVDPLFPGDDWLRLQQMDSYRDLKLAIEGMKLLVPSYDPRVSDNAREIMAAFRPTHVVHLVTEPPDFDDVLSERNLRLYAIRSGLRTVDDALHCAAAAHNRTADRWQQPRFLYVTSGNSADTPWTDLPSIVVGSYYNLHDFPTTLLRLPYLYGPMVASLKYVSDYYMHEKMFVTHAIAAILAGLEWDPRHRLRSLVARHPVVDLDSGGDGTSALATYYQLKRLHKRETGAWVELGDRDDLGNAATEADYLDFFGVPRNHFPCASDCRDRQCLPSAFDAIRGLVRSASEGCQFGLYFGNFSPAFEYLEQPRGSLEDRRYCRFAFLSGQSRFVRNLLSDRQSNLQVDSEEDTRADAPINSTLLYSSNGKHVVGGWKVFWLPEHNEHNMTGADLALLRIDPAGLFARSLVHVLYTEKASFMRASNEQLEYLFREMQLERVGARMRKVRRPGTTSWRMVKIRRQRARRVFFYAKERSQKYAPKSLDDFVNQATTSISQQQIDFYNESTSLVMSVDTGPQFKSSNALPYQWISYSALMHDLSIEQGRVFRCGWYKEFLLWGGHRDSEVLSLAYTMWKRRVEGVYGEPIPREISENRDFSWIPVNEKYHPDYRIKDDVGREIFIRILPN